MRIWDAVTEAENPARATQQNRIWAEKFFIFRFRKLVTLA